jgi:hypothetical protein
MTIPTLQRIAEAFDVALLVRFAAFSELVEWACSLSPDRLNTVSYGDDSKLHSLVRDPVGVSLESASLPVETSQYEAYMSVLVLDHKATRGPYRPVPHTSTTANTLSFPVGGTDDVGTRRSHAT